jgi:hypothetical protein
MQRSKPIQIQHHQHHRVRKLPLVIDEYVDYVPVAKSLNDSSVCLGNPTKINICQEIKKHVWQLDKDSKVCMRCRSAFSTLWRPRHHCRMCGQLACSACTDIVQVGFAHQLEDKLLVTSLESFQSKSSLHRICTTCQPVLRTLDQAYALANILTLVMYTRPDIAHQENAFHLFKKLACVSRVFYIAASQLKKILVSSQYIYGNPWSLDIQIKHSYKYQMTKRLLTMMEPYVRNHEFYQYALQYYKVQNTAHPRTKQPCAHILCRNVSHGSSMEVEMTSLFFQHQDIEWTLELATCLTPTLLWRKQISTIVHLVQTFRQKYIPMLFVWLHAFPFGAGYVDQFRKILPTTMWKELYEEWDYFHRLCEVARTCKNNVQDPRFRALARELAQAPKCLPGYPALQVVSIDVHSKDFCQADSSSKPFILPCKIFHVDTHTYSKQKLLIKHCQSMGSDGFVHLWIRYMKTLVPDASTIVTYPSIPIGSYSGILLMVANSTTLSNLTKISTIHNKLYNNPHTAHLSRKDIDKAFATSAAFPTILTCFIGLRDRIASNMMLLPNENALFHIDHEYMFNKQPPMKETIRSVGNFLESYMTSSSTTSSHTSSQTSHFLEMHNETIVMKPLLPTCVMSMLGGQESHTYVRYFVPSFNYYFQLMWNHRHVLYFASQFLTYFPSTTDASQLTRKEHDRFFSDLANVVLQGSDTYGEFACKVVLSQDQSKPWTEKVLDQMSKWSRGSKSR